MQRRPDPNFWPHGDDDPPLSRRDVWIARILVGLLALAALGEIALIAAVLTFAGSR